ncbi:MAG: hypothetical protein HY282_01240 [Nitrospirae bacterium]|nr:hypothetical protein [Candidatus Manganitrophaceae bacterium]
MGNILGMYLIGMDFTDQNLADLLQAAEKAKIRLKQLQKQLAESEKPSEKELRWIQEQMMDLEAVIRDIHHLIKGKEKVGENPPFQPHYKLS